MNEVKRMFTLQKKEHAHGLSMKEKTELALIIGDVGFIFEEPTILYTDTNYTTHNLMKAISYLIDKKNNRRTK